MKRAKGLIDHPDIMKLGISPRPLSPIYRHSLFALGDGGLHG